MAIKHLTPKSREEIQSAVLDSPASLEKINLLNSNYIEVTKEEALQLVDELPIYEKLRFALKVNNVEIVKKILDTSCKSITPAKRIITYFNKDDKPVTAITFNQLDEILTWAFKYKQDDIIEYIKKNLKKIVKDITSFERIQFAMHVNDMALIKKYIYDVDKNKLQTFEAEAILRWIVANNHDDILSNLIKKIKISEFREDYLRLIIQKIIFQPASEKMVRMMLDAGMDVHMDMDYPLVEACNMQKINLAKLLIEYGANIHAQGEICLRNACIMGNIEIIKMLLHLDADIHAENDEALRLAAANGRTELVKLLIAAGANVKAHNYLAIYWAEYNRHTEIVNILKAEQTRIEETKRLINLAKNEQKRHSKTKTKRKNYKTSNIEIH